MKKLLLIGLLAVSVSVSAQVQKGSTIIGTSLGNLSYNFETDVFSATLNPFAAKFVTDRLAIGGGATLGVVFVDGPALVAGVQPMARLYNKSTAADRFFVQAGAGVTSIIHGDADFYFSYNGGVGYNRFINQNLALELGLQFNGIATDEMVNGNNLALSLGVQVFLAKGERLFRRR
ncbi:hypothetical protein [Aridibaculum aurantiacum]|uniref:hypothetical protein n=1 Tax=Aridibaculum aurantiacum TaxID=2810307 RepID=UPI001A971F76|nr:hypothetical protein [Aridibaculum aurantiacum]